MVLCVTGLNPSFELYSEKLVYCPDYERGSCSGNTIPQEMAYGCVNTGTTILLLGIIFGALVILYIGVMVVKKLNPENPTYVTKS